MEKQSSTRILLMDNAPAVRAELAGRLGTIGYSVVVADRDTPLSHLLEAYRPEIVITEIDEERPDEIVSLVRSLSTARLIATVPSTAPPYCRVRAIRAGADDIIVKPFDINELLERIGSLRSRYFSDGDLTFEDIRIDDTGHQVYRGSTELELTATEYKLLSFFVRNAGRVVSKRQLLETIWGFEDYDVNLVEVHVSALRKKLETAGPRVLQTIRNIGYVLRSPVPSSFQQETLQFDGVAPSEALTSPRSP